jgi:hypothetical protein
LSVVVFITQSGFVELRRNPRKYAGADPLVEKQAEL